MTFDSAGIPIYYEVVGEGPPVVFLHGFGGKFERERYKTMIESLSGYQIIGIDVRGFGRSGKPADVADYGLEMARDYARLLDHLNLDSAHLIGHSMGGIIGLKVATLFPGRIRSLVLAGQGWLREDELEEMAAGGREALADPDHLPDYAKPVVERHGFSIFSMVAGYSELFVSPAQLHLLKIPILSVMGSEDPRMDRATRLREALPATRVVVISGKQHGQEIQDQQFGESVASFLSESQARFAATSAEAGQRVSNSMDSSLYQGLRYRLVGPFRASRTVGAVGIPVQPNVFFIGVNNGGVWKSDDYGRTWEPIFDEAPTGSVGDLAVSPSHPNILYVGSGEGLHRPDLSVGDGIFKSVDGGRTWKPVGLRDVQQVGRLIVHPTNPDIVFVAALGHPYGPNEQRGVFRTLDGGGTWEKVLYIDHNTGAVQVEFDPNNPQILFADLWEHREGPWENAAFSGDNSGLYKSTDGGEHWRPVSRGLPTAEQGLGRIGVGIAPSDSNRMYATVDAQREGGIYRSDDAGESWYRVNEDRRLWGRGGDFAEIRVHPRDPNHIYVSNVAFYESRDGGHGWVSTTGAPGGNDYHRLWINPIHPEIMLIATDQGATVSVNGGKSWGSWYNQPTAQLYHVATDNQFPYWIYGGQQESGAIGTASRGNGGQISFRDWIGVGADEYAYVAPDPKDPNIIYGGRVSRFDKRTGQAQNVAPEALRSGKYRMLRTMPLLFHPADPEQLLFATNVLWSTRDGGQSWTIISPDLSREKADLPESIGDFRTPEMENMARRGVIYAVAPSPLNANTIWAGTDDGLVHLTRDAGLTWADVTPPDLQSWEKVSQIDAGHFSAETAYLAVNAIRRSDMRSHIYRTHDGGGTWKRITEGLEQAGPVNVVREDPKRPNLLFAGSERHVYFSVDDGDHWNLLRNNLPPTSIRDLVMHDDDLVVGTHGRSIWVLDNIAPLRELAEARDQPLFLFSPPLTTRVRDNMFSDTPLPIEEPAGKNPPDGAILDYLLTSAARSVVLEVFDQDGNQVRRFTSDDPPEQVDPAKLPHPTYWIRPVESPGTAPGHHRFIWDLRYAPPPGTDREFSIAATYRNTPSGPQGPFVHPGSYRIRLTVDGQMRERRLEVRMDPRVQSTSDDLRLQTEFSMRAYGAYLRLQDVREQIESLQAADPSGRRLADLALLRGEGEPGLPDPLYGSISEVPGERENIVGLQQKFLYLMTVLQAADVRPTSQIIQAFEKLEAVERVLLRRWEELQARN